MLLRDANTPHPYYNVNLFESSQWRNFDNQPEARAYELRLLIAWDKSDKRNNRYTAELTSIKQSYHEYFV